MRRGTTTTTDAPDGCLLAGRRPEIGLAVLALATFAATLAFDFTSWDDGATLYANPLIVEPGGFGRIWTSAESEQYYPLTWTAYWLQYRVFGPSAGGYHAVCVLLHVLDTLLAFRLLLRFGLPRNGAFFAAALFAVHPVQVMSVAWVAEQKNLLSAAFALAALLLWTRPERTRRHEFLAAAAFALGLLAKTAILGLPAVFVAYDRLVRKDPLRRALRSALPGFALAAASALPTFLFEQKFVAPSAPLPPLVRPLVAASALLFYLGKLLFPLRLSPIYPRFDVDPHAALWWGALLVIAGLAVLAWKQRGRLEGRLGVATVLFGALLFPTLGFVNYGNLALTFVSDHYLYLASLGPFLLAGIAAARRLAAPHSVRGTTTILAAIVLLLLARTGTYLPTFANATTMWETTLRANPRCFAALFGLGQERERAGLSAEAAEFYRLAAASVPSEADAWIRLGGVLLATGDPDGAAGAFRMLHEHVPGHPAGHFGLGAAAEAARRFPEAEAHYRRGIQAAPDDAFGRLRLATLLLGLGRREEARPEVEHAIRLRPSDPWPRVMLATIHRGAGRLDEAIAVLEANLAGHERDIPSLNLLARIRATATEERHRDGRAALALATRAAELTRGRDPRVIETLAAAHAELGSFEEAAALAAAARRLVPDGPLAANLERQAAQYAERRPLREAASDR